MAREKCLRRNRKVIGFFKNQIIFIQLRSLKKKYAICPCVCVNQTFVTCKKYKNIVHFYQFAISSFWSVISFLFLLSKSIQQFGTVTLKLNVQRRDRNPIRHYSLLKKEKRNGRRVKGYQFLGVFVGFYANFCCCSVVSFSPKLINNSKNVCNLKRRRKCFTKTHSQVSCQFNTTTTIHTNHMCVCTAHIYQLNDNDR